MQVHLSHDAFATNQTKPNTQFMPILFLHSQPNSFSSNPGSCKHSARVEPLGEMALILH